MNEGTVSRFSEWVWRRLEQPLNIGKYELPPYAWFIVLGAILAAAFFYVGWMYIKDSRSVGPWWATLLGLLRSTVYVVLAVVFLLPAQENYEQTTIHSKVVTIHDVSGSHLYTFDDPITAGGPQLSRQDKVYNFLTDPKVHFLPELEKKNPVSVYRFAAWADENDIYLDKGRFYTRTEWEKHIQETPRVVLEKKDIFSSGAWKKPALTYVGGALLALATISLVGLVLSRRGSRGRAASVLTPGLVLPLVLVAAGVLTLYKGITTLPPTPEEKPVAQDQPQIEARPLSKEYLACFLKPNAKTKIPAGASRKDAAALQERIDQNEELRKTGFFDGTSVGDSVLTLFNREQNNKVQGIVIFSDGHSTSGSAQAYRDLVENAKAAKIPIFVVGIGENRPNIKTEIAEIAAPAQAQPDDKFPVAVEVTGVGRADKELPVELIITNIRKGKDGKDVPQPIMLREAENRKDPSAKRDEIDLGKQIIMKQTVKLDRGTPPRGRVEFRMDALALAEAAQQKLPEGDPRGPKKKWELGETKDSELHFNVRVPKDKREILNPKETFAVNKTPSELRVIKKPLHVLLFASAPTREYQFLRTLLVREMEKKRLELSIHLQLPPGRIERRTGVVQDVPKERLLDRFPYDYGDGKDPLYDLANYDVIIAFDPDWTQLKREQLVMLAGDDKAKIKGWVDKGGGLIVIGGPINTIQLARPSDNKDIIQLVRDLYPVVPKDYRIEDDDRDTKDPHALQFPDASPDMEFMKLEESDQPLPFLKDWQEYFYGTEAGDKPAPGKTPIRGFYNFFPVEKVKQGSLVVARFIDENARMKDKERSYQPFMVVTDKASGRRVVWIGAGETWRLRSYKEAYHERFWTKLIRYAGATSHAKINRHIELMVASEQKVNQPILIEARIDGDNGKPLGADVKPELTLVPPIGVQGIKLNFTLKAKPGRDGWFTPEKPVQVPLSGKYGLDLKVPGMKEVQHVWFQASAPNLEKEETQPDFARLYYMASEAQEVLDRMTSEADKRQLREALTPPRMDDSAGERSVKDSKRRLFFTLKNAHLIPKCMGEEISKPKIRLPYKDVWDEGWTVFMYDGKPVKLSWVLTIIVGLLSLEWLTRKLLRLA